MNLKKIETVLALFENAQISAINLEEADFKISLKKELLPLSNSESEKIDESIQPESIVGQNNSSQERIDDFQTLKSSYVGFFHPKIDLEPSEIVKKGTPVYSIKAMNIEHDFIADKDYFILNKLIEEGTPVGYGQELFQVKEAA